MTNLETAFFRFVSYLFAAMSAVIAATAVWLAFVGHQEGAAMSSAAAIGYAVITGCYRALAAAPKA